MNKEEAYSGEWPVKPYYKRDLAMGYAPDITPVAALNRLSAWIHHHKSLYQALLDSGYVDRQRIFNSVQVDFGELGKFRLQIASVGTEKLTDFTAAHITRVNIQYVPGEDLKTIFGALEFQPVASRAAQAAALRAEKEGKAVADLLKTKDEPGV